MKIVMYVFIFIGMCNSLIAVHNNKEDIRHPLGSAKSYLKYHGKSIKDRLKKSHNNDSKEKEIIKDYAFFHRAFKKNHEYIEKIKRNVTYASADVRSPAKSNEQLRLLRTITIKNATNKFNTLLEYAALSTNKPHTSP